MNLQEAQIAEFLRLALDTIAWEEVANAARISGSASSPAVCEPLMSQKNGILPMVTHSIPCGKES